MKRLNILELHRTINEKNNRKNECYDKVLEICHKKINMAPNLRQLRCMIEVPEYVCGYPLYDLNSCIKYLLDSLKVNGFLVKYYFPKVLYVSWDFDEIKNDGKPQTPVQTQQHVQLSAALPSVQPQKRLIDTQRRQQTKPSVLSSSLLSKAPASLNMKTTGKLELNLF